MSTSNPIRQGGRSRPGRLMALLTATAVAASLLSAPSGPAAAVAAPAPATAPGVATGLLPDGAEPVPVTLITGDTVLWADVGGNARVVDISPAERDYPIEFDQAGTQTDFYVIPYDIKDQVVAGEVDRELFNIPGLIRQGLDDQSTGGELPLIVTFETDRTPRQLERDANALPAAGSAQALEEVNGAAVTLHRSGAGKFRDALLGKLGRARGPDSTLSLSLDAAVDQVLLDRVLKIDLADSVPQIGAPQAWQAGYTGDGVTVAVLDTGIDTSHPDLAGQVVAEANFTDEPDATDTHGHGSHVASTIAGTGAASGGTRKGVAPGAELVSGKVCNSNGDCQTSWIMAGMQWATTVQGADVVNMSLGGGPTDGTDPLAQLLDELSAQTGALFVTSAGNSGPGRQRVGSPGAADAALAVGAVDKSDQMAQFSSRGPRIGNHAVKPEITAPGVGIIAARAAGTGIGSPVDDHYTAVNGTSMASPHVAGAAALLAEARGLTGQALKDALVSTAADGGHRWYEQGTGRVDIPAALNSPVYAQGTVNLGGVDGQAEQTITYVNRSSNDITLTLDATVTDHTGQPLDDASLSADRLVVPGGGQASTTLTVTADLTGAEHTQSVFGGVITATATGVDLRTAVGFGPPLHRVEIEVLDSTGQPIGSPTAIDNFVWLVHDTFVPVVGGRYIYTPTTSSGKAVVHLPTGTYTAFTTLLENEPAAGPFEFTRSTTLVALEVKVGSDVSITLDARDAVPVSMPDVPRTVEMRNHNVVLTRELPTGAGPPGSTVNIGAAGELAPVFVTPTPVGTLASLILSVSWILAEPQPQQPVFGSPGCPVLPTECFSETPAYVYNLLFMYEEGVPQSLHERVGHKDLVAVPTRFHGEYPDTLVGQQFQTIVRRAPIAGNGRDMLLWFKPGLVTEYFIADDRFEWNRLAAIERRPEGQGIFRMQLFSDDYFPAAEAGHRRSEEPWFEAPIRLGAVDTREEFIGKGFAAGNGRFAVGSRSGADGNLFVPGIYTMDSVRGHHGLAQDHATWRMWNIDDGTELDPTGGLVFPLAPVESSYQLEQVEEFSATSTGMFRTGRATTKWTFTSTPSSAHAPSGYRCPIQQAPRADVCQIQPLIQLEYHLGLDIHNQAPAGRAHRFTILAGHHSKAIDRARVTSLTVQASFDDGATWHDARVVGKPKDSYDTGGLLPSSAPYQQYRVVLPHPPLYRTNGYVTLRVQAADAAGGTVDQTIERAYILR